MPTFNDDPVVSVSNSSTTPAVKGESSRNEGVRGVSHNRHGGVVGINDWTLLIVGPGAGGNGGWFESEQGEGVRGWAKNPDHGGVVGVNTAGGFGVYGQSDDGIGVVGESKNSEGVRGVSHHAHHAVVGVNDWTSPEGRGAGGNGGWFESEQGDGVRGRTKDTNHAGVVGENTKAGIGVFATSRDGAGVWATSVTFEGVHAETSSPATAAIAAYNLNPEGTGAAVFARKDGDRGHAGFFDGKVFVSDELAVGKDIILLNADCAEEFDIVDADLVDPGTVMVLGEEGALHPSHQAYDKRVAGVLSGAGDHKPGIVLDRQQSRSGRKPVALLGKVFCKVDASHAPVGVGDLLTTSDRPGHAMKAVDPAKAFGAVIGKALRPLNEGQGLIPILVALQ